VKEYVLDANAVTRYLGVSKGGGVDKIDDLIDLGLQGRVLLLMSVINLGEAAYVLLKHFGEDRTVTAVRKLVNAVTMVDVDYEAALEASRYRHTYHVGYADAFAVALALKRKATLVSADPAFEKFGQKLKWLRLPAYAGKK
jgi:predicted nucleic acid-binding protein